MWRIMREEFKMQGCKTCIHKVDKKKKDQVEPRKYEFKDGSTYETPQSPYANQKCDKGQELKFGIIECPFYSRDLGMVGK